MICTFQISDSIGPKGDHLEINNLFMKPGRVVIQGHLLQMDPHNCMLEVENDHIQCSTLFDSVHTADSGASLQMDPHNCMLEVQNDHIQCRTLFDSVHAAFSS